ncbi:hypothetical protein DYB31_013448, partial [Aphanomyces astaci]
MQLVEVFWDSRVGRMLDALMRSLEQDHQEWVLHQEGKRVVEVMTKSIKPESLKTAVQKQLQLQRSKALKSDVFRYVNWLRTFAAGHQLYVGLDDESTFPGSEAGRSSTRPRLAKPKCWKDGINQRQKSERGVLLENIVRVDDVLLDSGSDVTVVTRGVMDALDAAGVKVGTVSQSVPHLAYPYGSDVKPVVMSRSGEFNCVTLDTTCGPHVLRGLKAWVDDASTATELIVSRPIMELLGLSVEDLLVGARKKKEEWDVLSVPTNELSGMANVKRLMGEKLNPPELDPDDGMERATPEVYPKISIEDEAERRPSHSDGQDSRGGDARAFIVFREDLGDDPP